MYLKPKLWVSIGIILWNHKRIFTNSSLKRHCQRFWYCHRKYEQLTKLHCTTLFSPALNLLVLLWNKSVICKTIVMAFIWFGSFSKKVVEGTSVWLIWPFLIWSFKTFSMSFERIKRFLPKLSSCALLHLKHGLRTPNEAFFHWIGMGQTHYGGIWSTAPILVQWVPCPYFHYSTIISTKY